MFCEDIYYLLFHIYLKAALCYCYSFLALLVIICSDLVF